MSLCTRSNGSSAGLVGSLELQLRAQYASEVRLEEVLGSRALLSWARVVEPRLARGVAHARLDTEAGASGHLLRQARLRFWIVRATLVPKGREQRLRRLQPKKSAPAET